MEIVFPRLRAPQAMIQVQETVMASGDSHMPYEPLCSYHRGFKEEFRKGLKTQIIFFPSVATFCLISQTYPLEALYRKLLLLFS